MTISRRIHPSWAPGRQKDTHKIEQAHDTKQVQFRCRCGAHPCIFGKQIYRDRTGSHQVTKRLQVQVQFSCGGAPEARCIQDSHKKYTEIIYMKPHGEQPAAKKDPLGAIGITKRPFMGQFM